jgi:hypothetical protein
MKKTKALATVIIGGLLVLFQLPAMGSLVIPTNAQAVGYDLTTLGLLTLGIYALIVGGRELMNGKPTQS